MIQIRRNFKKEKKLSKKEINGIFPKII